MLGMIFKRALIAIPSLIGVVIVTFLLTIFGTFMTRSGVVQSVHAFGEDIELARLFTGFMCTILIVSFGFVFYRLPLLRSRNELDSWLSREAAYAAVQRTAMAVWREGGQFADRLAADGPNELPTARKRNLLQQAWDVVREPMLLLLIGAGTINFAPSSGVTLTVGGGFSDSLGYANVGNGRLILGGNNAFTTPTTITLPMAIRLACNSVIAGSPSFVQETHRGISPRNTASRHCKRCG